MTYKLGSQDSIFDEIAQLILKIVKNKRFYIETVKTLDGIAASAILYKTLIEQGAKVIVRFSQGSAKQSQIPSSDYKIGIGVNLEGADLLIGIDKGITPDKFGYERLFGGSLSVMAQLLREKISANPASTYHLALIGAFSSFQDTGEDRSLKGLNEIVLEKALLSKLIVEEEKFELPFGGLLPLQDSIALSYDPYFKGITGNQNVAVSIIKSAGIDYIKEGRFISLRDLKPEELKIIEKALERYSTTKTLKRKSYSRAYTDESSFDYSIRDMLFMLEPLIVKNEFTRAFNACIDSKKEFNTELFYESVEETRRLISIFNTVINTRERLVDEGFIIRIVGTGMISLSQLMFIYKWVYRWDESKNKVILAETNEGPEEVFITLEKDPINVNNLQPLIEKYNGRIVRQTPFIIIYVNVIKAGLLYEDMRKMIAGVP